MSRAQYLKSLERDICASAKIINELTRENYELKMMLIESTKLKPRHETEQPKNEAVQS